MRVGLFYRIQVPKPVSTSSCCPLAGARCLSMAPLARARMERGIDPSISLPHPSLTLVTNPTDIRVSKSNCRARHPRRARDGAVEIAVAAIVG